MNRGGEKNGWFFGWIGGFVWIDLLGLLWIIQDKVVEGVICMFIFLVALFAIIFTAPWKYPDTKYWKLMLPQYALLVVAILVSIFLSGGLNTTGMKWTYLFWIFPCLIPLFTLGKRTWNDGREQDAVD